MADLRKQLEKEFDEMDKDKNGFLDEAEMQAAITACGYKLTPAEVKCLFQDIDTSGDGKISKEEFCKAIEIALDPSKHEEAMLRRAFSHYDKDKSGTIDMQELKTIFEELGEKIPEERLKKIMELVDRDKSGSIDIDEFLDAFRLV